MHAAPVDLRWTAAITLCDSKLDFTDTCHLHLKVHERLESETRNPKPRRLNTTQGAGFRAPASIIIDPDTLNAPGKHFASSAVRFRAEGSAFQVQGPRLRVQAKKGLGFSV